MSSPCWGQEVSSSGADVLFSWAAPPSHVGETMPSTRLVSRCSSRGIRALLWASLVVLAGPAGPACWPARLKPCARASPSRGRQPWGRAELRLARLWSLTRAGHPGRRGLRRHGPHPPGKSWSGLAANWRQEGGDHARPERTGASWSCGFCRVFPPGADPA